MKITRMNCVWCGKDAPLTRDLPITDNQLMLWESNKFTHQYETHTEFLELIMPDLNDEERDFFQSSDRRDQYNAYQRLIIIESEDRL